MFKRDKQQVFSLRKYKGYGLASAVIAAFFLAQTVSADVVDNGNNTTTISNDKSSIVVESSKFKDDNNKTATELYNEGSYDAEKVTTGKESVTVESTTTVKYQTENSEQINEDVTKSTSETKELDYKVTGNTGKEYTSKDSASTSVDATLEKKDVIENDGKKYEYVRTETTVGKESTLTETSFNDVDVKASVQGMHNEDGSIKYDKIKNGTRVWVLEELQDGSYGKYTLIENAQNLNDDQIREAAKTATSKFSKAEVEAKGGFKSTDSIVVYETNTYAARKQSTAEYGKEFRYNQTASDSRFDKKYIDEIYKVGLESLEKHGEKYYYKGKEVVTTDDFKKKPVPLQGDPDKVGYYETDTDNKYYFESLDNYVVPTTYYEVISDFLIKHPDSPIFANQVDNVLSSPHENPYFAKAFIMRLMNSSLTSKYNLTVDTENFTNKQLESKAENSRPTENKTYSFVKRFADDQEIDFTLDTNGIWKHEIGLSYSTENVENVRNWIKGYQSLKGETMVDPFNGKDSSEVSKQEYIDAVADQISSFEYSPIGNNLTSEQIEELRPKLGTSTFMRVGKTVQYDYYGPEKSKYTFTDGYPTIERNSPGVVTEKTESFTYHDVITPLRAYRLSADENIVRHIYTEVKKGSVVATYSDEDGNKLAEDVSVKKDAYSGEDYHTEAKTIDPVSEVETVNGLTKTTTTRYELIKTPENADGKVAAETNTIVPYVYRKVVTVETNGSVVATYKDEEGTILATEENVVTNKNAGTSYSASAKQIQSSTSIEMTETGKETTITTYELIKTPNNASGTVVGGETIEVQYIYRKIETVHLIPNDTPIAEADVLKVTRFHTDQGEELKSDVEGFENADKIIDNYEFTGRTELSEAGDVQTHIYTKILSEIPNESPRVELTEAKITRYMLEDRKTEIADWKSGLHEAEQIVGNYQYTGITETDNDGFVRTHIYKLIETKVPEDAPKLEKEIGYATRYVLEDRITEIKESQSGLHEADRIIGQYQFTSVTDQTEDGSVISHIYKLIENKVPNDSPILDKTEYHLTRFVDEDGNELIPVENGFVEPKDKIEDFKFTGKSETDSGILTHIYSKIKVETKVPDDAPVHEKEALKITRYVDEDGNVIAEESEGFVQAPKNIKDYEFTGKTDLSEDGNIQTHIYHKVVETPNVPDKHETPKSPETQKTIEICETPEIAKVPETPAKLNVKQTEKFVKERLPETGTESSSLALFGLASLFGSLAFMKRHKED